MALKSFVAGDNILVTYSKTERNLRDAGESFYNVNEVIENEVREWVALTQAAASGAVTAKSGEASMTLVTGTGAEVQYEHDANEGQRYVGSYTYKCSAQKKTITFPEEPE